MFRVRLGIPRDRAGTFDPQLIAKYQRRFPDFDDEVVSMYAHGMSTRAIRGHLEGLYGTDMSPNRLCCAKGLRGFTSWVRQDSWGA